MLSNNYNAFALTYPMIKLTHFESSDDTDEKTLVKILLKNYNEE